MNCVVLDEEAMLMLSGRLARMSHPPLVIFLEGVLGAGKTTFCRGFLQALGYQGKVKSPTYALVESYEFPFGQVHHFDFYRIHDPLELEHMGIQEYFTHETICLIEWAEQGMPLLPAPDLRIKIEMQPSGRRVRIEPHSDYGRTILKRFEDDA